MFSTTRLGVAALILFALPALAQDAPKVRRVSFKDGLAVIKGAIKGYASNDYVFPAGAGESIRVELKSGNLANYFNINPPGSEEAIFIGSTSGSIFDGSAPMSGDYTVRVYLMRSEARRGARAAYVLTIRLGQKSQTQERGPDFADGLTGGPDYWEVAGVPAGDTLNLRATPSPGGKLVTSVANGATLRNLGCKNTRGQRWCRVEQAQGQRGWANGKFLRESAGPAR